MLSLDDHGRLGAATVPFYLPTLVISSILVLDMVLLVMLDGSLRQTVDLSPLLLPTLHFLRTVYVNKWYFLDGLR
jgi:hypothetical protein